MDLSRPLCARLQDGELLAEGFEVVAFADGFPVTEGHALVVPRRHVARVADCRAWRGWAHSALAS